MQGDPQIIGFLNQALMAEMTAHEQYFLEGRMLSDWGFKKLAHGLWRDYAEVHHNNIRTLVDRIIFLEGAPDMTLATFTPGNSVQAMLAAGLNGESAMRALYAAGAKLSDDMSDFVTEEIATDILIKIERRIKKITTQIKLIGSVGLELYLQKKI